MAIMPLTKGHKMVKIILLILSVICFTLLVFSIAIGSVNLLALGLAFGFASMLPWRS